LVALGAGEGEAGLADPFFAEAGFLAEQFDVLHEVDVGIQLHEGLAPAVEGAAFVPAAGLGEVPELLVLFREGDAAAADPAVDAEDGGLEEEVVDAGEDLVAVADEVAEFGDAAGVGAAFFDGVQVWDVGELDEHFRGDVGVVADGVVVEHPGERGGLGEGAEPVLGFLGIGFVDHGRHDHEARDAEIFAVLHVGDGGPGAHFGDAADDGHTTCGDFDGAFDHGAFFIRQEGLVFAERTADDEAGSTGFDEGFEVMG
jgi:hypothetical protein